MRIPRKLKKKYKKLWHNKFGVKLYVIKNSIEYTPMWKTINGKGIWGCMTRLKHDTI